MAAEAAIRAVVGKLIGTGGVRVADGDDVAQELRLHVAQKAAAHDPGRSALATYIEQIVTSKVLDILKADRAACRDRRKVESLDAPVESDDGEERTLGDTVDQVDALRRAGLLPWSAEDALVIDVKLVMEELSVAERLTCEVLSKTKSLREAATALGIHVETLRERMVQIRAEFVARGITGA